MQQNTPKEVPPEVAIVVAVMFLIGFGFVWFLILHTQYKKTGKWPKIQLLPKTRRRSVTVPQTVTPIQIMEPSPDFVFRVSEQRETDEVFAALGIPSTLVFPELEEELGTPEGSRSTEPIDADSAFAAVEQLVRGDVGLHPILDLDMGDRKHVIIAGDTGNGKTQGQIAMMVRDIKRGAQVFWLNPHLALYNAEDQPTDLRPIKDRFIQVFDYAEILGHMEAFVSLINERMPLYRNNQPVGHFIVIYLDEWPGVVQVLGDSVTDAFKMIAREGRKVRVFLNMASQDALVDTIGVKSGVRSQFSTRLVGRVDPSSWSALVGSGIPRIDPERRGEWSWARPGAVQKVQIDPASRWEIAEIAASQPRTFTTVEIIPHGNDLNNEHVRQLMLVSGWMAENPAISNREIARRLWPESGSGGGNWANRAKVLRDEVLRVTVTGGAELPVLEPVTGTPDPEVTVTEMPVTAVTVATGGNEDDSANQ